MKLFQVRFEVLDEYRYWNTVNIYGDNMAHVYQQFKKLAYTTSDPQYRQWTGSCDIQEVKRESCN